MRYNKLFAMMMLASMVLTSGCSQKTAEKEGIQKEFIQEPEVNIDESMMGVKADSYEEDTYDYPTITYRVTAADKKHVVTTSMKPIQNEIKLKDILDYPENFMGQWLTTKGRIERIVEEQGNYAVLKVESGTTTVLLEYVRPTGAPRAQVGDYIVYSGIFKGLVNDIMSGIIPNIETELVFEGAGAMPVLEVTPILNDVATGKTFVPNVDGDILKCYENDMEVWGYSYGINSIKENRENMPQNVGMIDRFNTIDLYQDENNNLVVTGNGTLKPKGEPFNMQFVFTKEGELLEAIEIVE